MNHRAFTIAFATLVAAATLPASPGVAHAGPQDDDCAASLVQSAGISRDKAEKVCGGAALNTDEPGLDDCVTSLVQTQGISAGRAKGVCDGTDPAGGDD